MSTRAPSANGAVTLLKGDFTVSGLSMEKTVVCWAIVLAMCVTLGQAQGPDLESELWVAPADHPGNHVVGNWTVTPNGDTHFGFGIPANFDALEDMTDIKATIVLIPGKNDEITFDLLLSVARDGDSEDVATLSDLEIPATLVKEQLQEIDVFSIFSEIVNPGLGPDDYVSLHFKSSPPGNVRVFGMRFIYDRILSLGGAGCDVAGEVVTGFDDDGVPICAPNVPDVACPAGQVLTGFDGGVAQCENLLAGVTCASGEAIKGFDTAGASVCVPIEGDLQTTPLPDGSTPPAGLPLLSIANASQNEGNSGMAGLTFEVTLTPTSLVAVTVQYATKDGTAQADAVSGDGRNTVGGDYVAVAAATPGLLTIPPNTATGTFDIQINGDADIENSEFFQVFLFNPSEALIDDGKGLRGILNDDP